MAHPNKINNDIYSSYGDRWYTSQDDPIALLRAESRAKVPWVAETAGNLGFGPESSLLDIGCGGGFLSNGMGERGFQVTGLDSSQESLIVAARYDQSGRVRYVQGDAYALPFGPETFDLVTAMDFLEHVEEPQKCIAEAARVLKPGGLFFYHTFNRNPVAGFVVIKLVEWCMKKSPENLHLYRMFLKPKEMEDMCVRHGLKVLKTVGLVPRLSTLTFGSFFRGVVPEGLEFQVVSSTLLSYMGVARK